MPVTKIYTSLLLLLCALSDAQSSGHDNSRTHTRTNQKPKLDHAFCFVTPLPSGKSVFGEPANKIKAHHKFVFEGHMPQVSRASRGRCTLIASSAGPVKPEPVGSSPAALVQAAESPRAVLDAVATLPLPGEEVLHFQLQLHHQRKRLVRSRLMIFKILALTSCFARLSQHLL
jgi:hypothetical protein